MYRFLSRKNTHLLKTFCFVFRHGCLLLVREESNKKTQVSWVWIDQSFRKSCWDRIVDWRISPIVWFDFCRWEKFKWNLYVIISKIIVLLGKLFKRILEHNWKHIFVLPIREYWERKKQCSSNRFLLVMVKCLSKRFEVVCRNRRWIRRFWQEFVRRMNLKRMIIRRNDVLEECHRRIIDEVHRPFGNDGQSRSENDRCQCRMRKRIDRERIYYYCVNSNIYVLVCLFFRKRWRRNVD